MAMAIRCKMNSSFCILTSLFSHKGWTFTVHGSFFRKNFILIDNQPLAKIHSIFNFGIQP